MNDRIRSWLVPPVLLPIGIFAALAFLVARDW